MTEGMRGLKPRLEAEGGEWSSRLYLKIPGRKVVTVVREEPLVIFSALIVDCNSSLTNLYLAFCIS
jgi:hypothetical protein